MKMNYYELTSDANQAEFVNKFYNEHSDDNEEIPSSFIQNLNESSLNAVGDFLLYFIEKFCVAYQEKWGKIFIPLCNDTTTSKIIFSSEAFSKFSFYYKYAIYTNKKTEYTMRIDNDGETENEDLTFEGKSYIKQDFNIKVYGACEYIEIDMADFLRQLGYMSQADNFVKAFCYQFHATRYEEVVCKKINKYAKEMDNKMADKNFNKTFFIMLLGAIPYVINGTFFPSNSQLLPIIFAAFSALLGFFYSFYLDMYSFKKSLIAIDSKSIKFKICFNCFKYSIYVWAILGLGITFYILWGLFI